MMEQALTGVKVIDLTWHIAALFVRSSWRDYGADVIKIERPVRAIRRELWGRSCTMSPSGEERPLLYLNTDKQGITLNLKSSAEEDHPGADPRCGYPRGELSPGHGTVGPLV